MVSKGKIKYTDLTYLKRNKNLIRKLVWIIGVLVVILIIAISLLLYLAPKNFTQQKDYVELLVKIVGGIALFLGAYFTWKQIVVSREGQITERFTRAVDQLGATHENGSIKPEIRLGGIYGLERIASDSAADHWQVMEILTAYVRENAPWNGETGQDEDNKEDKCQGAVESSDPVELYNSVPPLRPDIQAILTVIGRRKRATEEEEDQQITLVGTNLRKAIFREANLRRAILFANMEWADLKGANLEGAHLVGSYLMGARLDEANLNGARLETSKLKSVSLGRASLKGASLWCANLEGAYLGETNLEKANLARTNLQTVSFWKANLKGADIHGSNMKFAYLAEADLQGANLTDTDLESADLIGSNLKGSDLSNAKGLIKEQIESAFTDENTKLPEYLKDPIREQKEESDNSKSEETNR